MAVNNSKIMTIPFILMTLITESKVALNGLKLNENCHRKSLYSFFNDFNLKSEQQLKNQWPNGSKFTLRLFLVNFETFILVTIQCEHSMCETNLNGVLVDQRLWWRPLEVLMRTNVVFRLFYIISK